MVPQCCRVLHSCSLTFSRCSNGLVSISNGRRLAVIRKADVPLNETSVGHFIDEVCCSFQLFPGRMFRVGQNRIYAPYMTVYLVVSLPKIPYIHRIYMVLAHSTHVCLGTRCLLA